MHLTGHNIHDIATGVIAYASLAYMRMPHPEEFAAYPRFQRVYNFLFIFLRAISLNRPETPK